MECKHSLVCKFRRSDPCELEGICKFFVIEAPSIAPKHKGRKRGKYRKRKKYKKLRQKFKFSMSKEGIQAARKLLKERKRKGFLSDNQIRALDQYKNKSYENLEEIEKQQILDIVKDTNKPKTILENVRKEN